jgi:hypothetical protein
MAYDINKLIPASINNKETINNKVNILIESINDDGNYNTYAKFDIPGFGRNIVKTGRKESIYIVNILVAYNDCEKFNDICQSDYLYCTFPTVSNNIAIINKPLILTEKKVEGYFNIQSIGYTKYILTLEESVIATNTLQSNIITVNDLYSLKEIIKSDILENFLNKYYTVIDTIDTVKSKISKISETMIAITRTVNNTLSAVTELQNTLQTNLNNLNNLINLPNELTIQFDIIIDNFNNLTQDTKEQFNLLFKLITQFEIDNFSKDKSDLSNENYFATYPINEYMLSIIFIDTCINCGITDFNSIEEIENRIIDINNLYNKMIFIDNIDLTTLLQQTINYTNIILINKKETLRPFVNFNLYNITPIEFCYQIYNNIDNLDMIYKWNPEQTDLRILNGNVRVII